MNQGAGVRCLPIALDIVIVGPDEVFRRQNLLESNIGQYMRRGEVKNYVLGGPSQ